LWLTRARASPASFKDETLLRSFPQLVLDGALWAARAVGAKDIIICMKERSLNAAMTMETAIAQHKRAGERGVISH